MLALNGLYAIGDQHVRHNDAVTFDAANEALQRRIGIGQAVTAAQDVARRAGLEKYRDVLTLAAARERPLGDAAAQRMHVRRRARRFGLDLGVRAAISAGSNAIRNDALAASRATTATREPTSALSRWSAW